MNLVKRITHPWEPINVVKELQDEINRVFRHSVVAKGGWTRNFNPDIEIRDEADKVVVTAEIPGIKKEDLDIKVEGNRLILKGEKKHEKETKEKDYYFSERLYGSFSRTLELPAEINAEGVKAVCKDGLLEVVIPKKEGTKTKQIQVEVK